MARGWHAEKAGWGCGFSRKRCLSPFSYTCRLNDRPKTSCLSPVTRWWGAGACPEDSPVGTTETCVLLHFGRPYGTCGPAAELRSQR